jgi:hypothetical protein
MSAAEQQVQHTAKQRNAHERAALIAAVAGGMTQAEAAQHFNVHRNTVQRWCAAVRQVDSPVNPLRKEWRETARAHAQQAVIAGLKYKRDPYRAANIGLDVLRGLGDLQTGAQVNIDQSQNIVFAWSAPVEPQDVVNAQCATPVIEHDNA